MIRPIDFEVPPQSCPDCGGQLELIRDGAIGSLTAPAIHRAGAQLPIVMRLAPFLACAGCEYCIEVTRKRGRPCAT